MSGTERDEAVDLGGGHEMAHATGGPTTDHPSAEDAAGRAEIESALRLANDVVMRQCTVYGDETPLSLALIALDAENARLAAALAEHEGCDEVQAEVERHRNANLVRSVVEGYGPLDEAITEAINTDFDRVPWLIAVKSNEEAAALRTEREALREALDFYDHFFDEAFADDPFAKGGLVGGSAGELGEVVAEGSVAVVEGAVEVEDMGDGGFGPFLPSPHELRLQHHRTTSHTGGQG